MKICFAIPIFVILSLKICELNAAVLNEQFDAFPNYFNIYNENEGGTSTVLSTNVSDGILSFLTDGLSQDIEIELRYPVSSADTQTGILYFTVEAGNSAIVTDGGTFIDEDGDVEAINQAVAWLAFSSFSGDDEVALQNHNGRKRITFGDDSYIEVNEFDKVYLRLSYDFNTSITKQYYSTDGSNFIELHSSFAPNDYFSITLGAESNFAAFDPGEVYFDNFVIAEDMNYDSTLIDDPYSAYEYLGSSGEFIIYDDFNSADLNTDNWGTLAWNGGELPYTENNRVHFVGSQNPNSSLQGTLKSEYEHLGLPEMDNDSNSAIILKDSVLQNVHGIEFELLVSSSFQNDNTGLGFFCVEDFPYNYGFFMDAWRSSSNSKLHLEIGIYGNDILFGDSRFAYVGESEKAGYLSFTEIQYDTPYKIAYILKDDILYFYLDGIEIGQIEYDSSRAHNLSLFRGTNEFSNDYSGYIDDVRTYREFLDNDGDGVGNNSDIFPNDPTETTDTDGDGVGNNSDIDDDNDGIADSYDPSPLSYDTSTNIPTSLMGYVEIFFSDYYPTYGIWYGSTENNSINIWYDENIEYKFEDSYSWNAQNLTSTGFNGGGTFRINSKDKPNDLFFKFTYVSEGNELYADDSGKGFFYDGRIDLDENGMADGEQIANGLLFPATDSVIDLANIYNFSESNFIPIQVLDYAANEKFTLQEVQDLRAGSTMIEVSGNQATVQLQMEESSDLQTWEDTGTPATMTIPADTDTKFFRFKMAE